MPVTWSKTQKALKYAQALRLFGVYDAEESDDHGMQNVINPTMQYILFMVLC
jgi:hypothetical protein